MIPLIPLNEIAARSFTTVPPITILSVSRELPSRVLLYDLAAVFEYAVFRNDSAYAGCWIYLRMSSDYSTRVSYGVASHVSIVSEHGTDLACACLDPLSAVLDDNILVISLYVRSNSACAHVSMISEDGVSYVVVVRSLNMVKQDYVLELSGVSDYAVSSYKSGSSDESALSYFSVRSDDAW